MKPIKRGTLIVSLLVLGFSLIPETARSAEVGKQREGRIKGIVLDRNDARVPRAEVTLTSRTLLSKLKTDDDGQFEIALPPDTYKINVKADGFRKFSSGLIMLKVDETRSLNVHLKEAVPPGLVPAYE